MMNCFTAIDRNKHYIDPLNCRESAHGVNFSDDLINKKTHEVGT